MSFLLQDDQLLSKTNTKRLYGAETRYYEIPEITFQDEENYFRNTAPSGHSYYDINYTLYVIGM